MDLKKKVVLITGGRRVGQSVAREVAQAGATIVMTYLKDPDEVSPILKELGGNHTSYQLDISKQDSLEELTSNVQKDFVSIDALITMASIFVPDKNPITLSDIQNIFAVNAFGSMVLSRWFAESAKGANKKNVPIVSFIDWAVDHPYANHDIYLASKAALRHFLMALQTSYAGIVRVVNIHPGMILEPEGFSREEKQEIIENTPVHAIGTPEQAATLVRTALELDFWVDNVFLAGGQQWRHRL